MELEMSRKRKTKTENEQRTIKRKEALTNSQSDTEGGIYQFHLVIRKSADIISQHRFRNADQFITRRASQEPYVSCILKREI